MYRTPYCFLLAADLAIRRWLRSVAIQRELNVIRASGDPLSRGGALTTCDGILQMTKSDVRHFLERHLQGIFDYNIEHYRATTAEDLGLYEWYIVPQRIDGLPFHEFLMTEAALANATALTGAGLLDSTARPNQERPRVTFDLANYREQVYGDTAIASYTLLISTSAGAGVTVTSYNESRVMVKFTEGWKVVHVHKSPTYSSPLTPPRMSEFPTPPDRR